LIKIYLNYCLGLDWSFYGSRHDSFCSLFHQSILKTSKFNNKYPKELYAIALLRHSSHFKSKQLNYTIFLNRPI